MASLMFAPVTTYPHVIDEDVCGVIITTLTHTVAFVEWSLFTRVETYHSDVLTSPERGHAAFVASQMKARQGVAADNRKRFDL